MGAIEEYKARNAAREARRAEKQRLQEQRIWWFRQPVPIDRFTGWLVAWTALLFVATIGNVVILKYTDDKIGTQAEISARQLKIIESDERPWISTKIEIIGSFVVSDNAAQIRVRYTLENVGRTPAFNVVPIPHIADRAKLHVVTR